jgi:hypothetical protein
MRADAPPRRRPREIPQDRAGRALLLPPLRLMSASGASTSRERRRQQRVSLPPAARLATRFKDLDQESPALESRVWNGSGFWTRFGTAPREMAVPPWDRPDSSLLRVLGREIGADFGRGGSDAVREAGLQPGRWNKAYDDGYLFEHFIALARSLGRVPVSRELRLKARSDPSFPSHNTFNRIGSKRELVARVRKYCQGGRATKTRSRCAPPEMTAKSRRIQVQKESAGSFTWKGTVSGASTRSEGRMPWDAGSANSGFSYRISSPASMLLRRMIQPASRHTGIAG